ncbi:MAG: putative Zn-dependent peptidase [Chthonomonadaceae bacterium]|nr:putative Zn-dependent peptidase [Chthonomonadaceae bacterium]
MRTTRIALGLLTACLLPRSAAHAQRQQKAPTKSPVKQTVVKPVNAPPPLGPPHPLRLPAVVERTLPNGLRIVLLEDHTQPALWLRLALPAGSIRDPRNRVGLADMEAALLTKGTTTRTEAQIADTVDGLGASVGAAADSDYLTVSASGLSSYRDTLFALLSDVTLRPTFPTVEIDRYRTLTLNNITQALADGGTLADIAFSRRLYGGHPYGDFSVGTPVSLPEITQQDLATFHQTYFTPNVATLFVAGDITLEQATAKATSAFGEWERRSVPSLPLSPRPLPTATEPQITLIDRPGSAQTQIRIGSVIAGASDPKRYIASVTAGILGFGNDNGRLTREVRVKRGLTYDIRTEFARRAQAGTFEITTFTKTSTTAEVLRLTMAEAAKLAQDPPAERELVESKTLLNGEFALSIATTPGLLARLQAATLYGNGASDLTLRSDRILAVTAPQVSETLRNLNLRGAQIVLVGDAKAIEKEVRPFGKVVIIPADSLDLLSPTLLPRKTAETEAPTVKPTAADLDAGKALLAATIKAHGGDAFLNLKQWELRGKGEISPPGQDLKLPVDKAVLTFVPPGRSRYDLQTTFGNITLASDKDGSGWISALGQVQDSQKGVGSVGDPTDLLRKAAQGGYTVRPVAEKPGDKSLVDSDGTILRGFTITDNAANRTARVYVETDSGLMRRVVVSESKGDLTVRLGSYHNTAGVQLPGSLQITQNGKTFVTLTFDSFAVNKPIDDALFTRPK